MWCTRVYMSDSQEHWNKVYSTRAENEVSWFQVEAQHSLAAVAACKLASDAGILDVGGGASRLVDGLLARGYRDITVLDLSPVALSSARARLGELGADVTWMAANIVEFEPPQQYALWHDRAVFHFLTEAADRAAYVRVLERALPPGGHLLVSTFAPDGPERCSGLQVQRYNADALAAEFGASFTRVSQERQEHLTPGGKMQPFTYVRLVRR